MLTYYKQVLFLILLLLVSVPPLSGQELFSFRQCIDTAIRKNSQVNIALTEQKISNLNLMQSKISFIPSLLISNQYNFSAGRALDPTTYQFLTNRSIFDMSTTVGGSMTLFSGFERWRTIQNKELNLKVSQLETEMTKNDLALNVIALFVNIVLDKEAISICENKISVLQNQEAIIEQKLENKVSSLSELVNIRADITNAKIDLSSAVNQLNLDKVAMCELLRIDNWESFDITTEDKLYETIQPKLWNFSDVRDNASRLPQIKRVELLVDVARQEMSIASSAYWPTLKLNVGYGSTFSNARIRTGGEEYLLREQLHDNVSSYVSLSLNIPILNAISVSKTIKQKKLACERSGYQLVQVQQSLDKEIKQAIINANAAFEKYTLLAAEVDDYQEVLKQIGVKYELGAATYYDYHTALGDLYQAKNRQLQSKYEYIFRTEIINFYAGHLQW